MRLLFSLLILFMVVPCYADLLHCKNFDGSIHGHYDNNITPANMATFTTNSGEKIIFSFNNCIVIIE